MIEIIDVELVSNEEIGTTTWACWLEISQDGRTWMLPATAPGNLLEGELQAHFGGQESELWRVADEKQYVPNIYGLLEPGCILEAFVEVMLDEINILRGEQGLEPRTIEQLRQAIKAKL